MISCLASLETWLGSSDSSRLMVASSHLCGSGSRVPDSLSFFSPATVALLTKDPPPTAESTAGQPIWYASSAVTSEEHEASPTRAATLSRKAATLLRTAQG